jgi:hypothetical protein
MLGDAWCSHPGCGLPATDVAVVGSDWEDAASGSGLFLCENHARSYVGDIPDAGAIRRVSGATGSEPPASAAG